MKLNVKLFADGADIAGIREMASNSSIAGFTTNPTLMRKAGVSDYKAFAKEVLTIVPDKPVSFEVFFLRLFLNEAYGLLFRNEILQSYRYRSVCKA